MFVRVPFYYNIDVLSECSRHRFVFFFQQLAECYLQLLVILFIAEKFKSFMQTSRNGLPDLYILLVRVLVIQPGKVNVKGILLDFLLVEQVVIFMLILHSGYIRALSRSGAWYAELRL